MFRISKSKAPSIISLSENLAVTPEGGDLYRFCATENWTGDLANGLFQIGQVGGFFHGLNEGECGLLTLLRCYEPNDRVSILELLENASSTPSSFCFSTYIIGGPGDRQPLMCVGESISLGDSSSGSMRGVFVFPRMAPDLQGTH